jgi:hypothetical protein
MSSIFFQSMEIEKEVPAEDCSVMRDRDESDAGPPGADPVEEMNRNEGSSGRGPVTVNHDSGTDSHANFELEGPKGKH